MTERIDELTAALVERRKQYAPSDDVRQRLTANASRLLLLTGPAGVGKSTIMDAAGLSRVKSDTTRQPRENNGVLEIDGNEYYFRDLEAFAKDVANGSLVQFEWGGRPGIFYGSRPESYSLEGGAGAFAMDVRTSTVPDMVDVFPAGRAVPIQLVAPSASEWISRLDSRGTLAPEDRAMRLKEASDSITDALEGNKEGIDYMFLVSADLGVAAGALRRLATDGEISWADHVRAKNTARRNLLDMQDRIVR